MARLLTPTGAEVLVTVGRLKPGDRVIVSGGETVPGRRPGRRRARAWSTSGASGGSKGSRGSGPATPSWPARRSWPARSRSRSTRLGEQTRASSIRRALVAATSPAPGPPAPTIRSEAFASRAVGPTLATAGVGLLAGDLMTVGAILRPDYATGPGLAVPLETLHNVALCARLGIVARDPEALERLAEVNLFVLDDHPVLRQDRAGRGPDRDPTARADPAPIRRQRLPPPGRRPGDGPRRRLPRPAGPRCSTSSRSSSAGA